MPTVRIARQVRLPFALVAVPIALLLLAPNRAFAQAPASAVASGAPTDPTLERARKAVESNQAATVKSELTTYVKANPKSAAGAFWLGRVYAAEPDLDKASDWFEKAIALEPRNAAAHFWLGNVAGEQAMAANKLRQPFLAKKVQHEFEKAVALDPDYLDARAGLADFYRMAPGFMGGSIDKAHAQVEEIRRRDPLRGAYAAAKVALGEKKPDVAAREYERAIALAPDSVSGYLALAELRGQQGHWDDAWMLLDRYRARQPADPRLPYFTGRLAGSSGQRLDQGEQALALYLRQPHQPNTPSYGAAHWRLGQIREHRKDIQGARREYEAALKLDPSLRAAQQSLERLGK